MTYEMKHVSPSQIETWLGCNRQWYWEYVMGFKSPPKPSALIGTACHTVAEGVLLHDGEDCSPKKDGKDQYRAIVRPALPTLLDLARHVKHGDAHVEREMKRVLRNGLVLKGRIDFVSFHNPTEPLVVDHKTTSDLAYAKSEEELATNIQMLAYAYDAVCSVKGVVTGVRVAHNVMLTRGPAKARYTDVVIPVRDVHTGWTRIQDLSDKMLVTNTFTTPADVPENRSSCSKYGGCFHLSRCQALWAAKEGGAAPSPYATPVRPGESMSDVAPLPAHLLAKITGRPTLLPPEAPQNPRDRKAEAAAITQAAAQQAAQAAIVAKPPAPVVAQVVTATLDGAELLLSLGWSGDEVNAMTDDVFALVVKERWERKVCELAFGTPEADGFQAITSVNPNATQIITPVRRQRVAAPAPVVAEAKAWYYFDQGGVSGYESLTHTEWGARSDITLTLVGDDAAKVAHEKTHPPATVVTEAPKRRGRPPGSKNVAKAEPAAAQTLADVAENIVTNPPATPAVNQYVGGVGEFDAHEVLSLPDDTPEEVINEMADAFVIADLKAKLADYKADWEKHLAVISELRAENAKLEKAHQFEGDRVLYLEAELKKARAGQTSEPGSAPAASGFTLYVDCLPEKAGVPYRVLDEVLAPLMALAAANYKNSKGVVEPVSHYTLIPYNAGPGAVAAYVLTNLDKVVQPGILYVDTASPCAAAVLEVLRPKADAIVRARGR